ncbi:MAG TPA: helix-turn-helix domain-containing protein [Rudaea sp.]|nr:helix-turn-helix domain-containing protein [Rudaea sp.]
MSAGRVVPVCVVVPPRALLLDVAGPIEVLRRANLIQDRVRFDVRYVAASRRVHTSIGLELAGVDALPHRLAAGSLVVVSGSVDETIDGMRARGAEIAQETELVDWLRATVRDEHRLVTICAGALLAARAGLFDGHACTTHFLSCAQLAALAPHARVLENRLYVEDRRRLSSAGVTAGIDLMLHIVAQEIDYACALAVARYLVVYLRRSGNEPQLSAWLDGRNHIHPAVHRVQDAIAGDPAAPWPARRLAAIAGTSPRHLSRLFHEHVGMHIADYRNRLRAALARELLSQTRLDMERVAERAGFSSTRQLRRVWRTLNAASPRDERRATL